jgi:CDK-activating kinase assembly factor MAT1
MCSTCVDRIFTSGPASCPVVGCGKTLRKRGFHKAFFADLKIERECDIRRRVGEVFNRREDEFEDLRGWNDYLEIVEGLIFDLVEGTTKEKAKAEETLKNHRLENAKEIEDNKRAEIEGRDAEKQREMKEKEALRQRRLAVLREQEEEKMDVENARLEMLERLASGDGDANAITKNTQKVILKKSSARRNFTDTLTDANGSAALDLSIRGLKKKVAPKPELAYDAFGGLDLKPARYVLQDSYENEWLDGAKSNLYHMAGGYSMHEYFSRTMFEAFSGLGVFIGEKESGKDQPAASKDIGTLGAAEAVTRKVKPQVEVKEKDGDGLF